LRNWADDKLMRELIWLVRRNEIIPGWSKGIRGASPDDVFYIRPSRPRVLEREFLPLYGCVSPEKESRNRQLIVVYPEDFDERIACTRDLVDSIGFNLKKKEDISDYKKYEQAVVALLEFVAGHYAAPGAIAEWSLKQVGFDANP